MFRFVALIRSNSSHAPSLAMIVGAEHDTFSGHIFVEWLITV